MTAAVVMLTIVIAFLIFAALIHRAEEQETDDTDVWRRLIDRHDRESET